MDPMLFVHIVKVKDHVNYHNVMDMLKLHPVLDQMVVQ